MTNSETPPEIHTAPQPELVRGGKPSMEAAMLNTLDTTSRIFGKSVDIVRGVTDEGGHNPTRVAKGYIGKGYAAAYAIQTAEDLQHGDYGKAAYHGLLTGLITSTSYKPWRDALAGHALKIPGVEGLATGAGSLADKVDATAEQAGKTIVTTVKSIAGNAGTAAAEAARTGSTLSEGAEIAGLASKRLPVVGALLSLGMGGLAAGVRESHGDHKGAKGELVVTAIGTAAFVGVMAATTVASGLCGPAAPACAAVGLPMATGLAFAASEAASEFTARIYNRGHGTDVRGSLTGALAGFASRHIPGAHYIAKPIDDAINHVADAVRAAPHAIAHAVTHPLQTMAHVAHPVSAAHVAVAQAMAHSMQTAHKAWDAVTGLFSSGNTSHETQHPHVTAQAKHALGSMQASLGQLTPPNVGGHGPQQARHL